MHVEIDYNPSPRKTFFISVGLNETEAISFDNTSKGHRIIKQLLVQKKPFPKNKKPTDEWDALSIQNCEVIRYHIRWIDLGKKDWVNDEIWKTLWEKPLSKETADKLLYYSQFFSDHYTRVKKLRKEWLTFERYLKIQIKQLQ